MKESYFMGIDTGTNSSKGVLINSQGEIIAEHTTEHAMTNPAPGHYEHDADKDWWGDLCIISNALIENPKFHHLTLSNRNKCTWCRLPTCRRSVSTSTQSYPIWY